VVEYEFFFMSRKKANVHPALEPARVFSLEPDGVHLHWLTDGAFEKKQKPPLTNLVEENRLPPWPFAATVSSPEPGTGFIWRLPPTWSRWLLMAWDVYEARHRADQPAVVWLVPL